MEWILEPMSTPPEGSGGCSTQNGPCGLFVCQKYFCHHCPKH